MNAPLSRRRFLASSALAAGMSLGAGSGFAQATAPRRDEPPGAASIGSTPPLVFKTKLKKALIARPTEDDLKRMKEAGFDGVEGSRNVTPQEAAKTREIAEGLGMRIHSVLYGWAEFNSPQQSEVDRTFGEVEEALRTAEAFGADTILLVPCRVGGSARRGAPTLPMPRPWEFQIEFDDRSGHLSRVVYGDNSRFADYIKAHNHATDTSTAAIKRLIPLAEKTKVVIALENVGNNLWVQPRLFRHFVESFQSPWVKAYFDIGNHVRFAPPEQWILTLNTLLAKIHVKDYRLDAADPDGRGASVNIREGSVRWPVLRQALEAVGYDGWMTIESNAGLPLEERSSRLDAIIAGR